MSTPHKQSSAAGTLDQRFGPNNNGKILFSFANNIPSFFNGVALQADGKLLFTGNVGGQYVIARLNKDGIPDRAFGKEGAIVGVFENNSSARGMAVSQVADEKILLIALHTSIDAMSYVVVAKFLENGEVDTAFGNGGRVILTDTNKVRPSAGSAGIHPLAGQKILVHIQYSDPAYSVIARLNEDGSPDIDFGESGYITVRHPDFEYTYINALHVNADASLLAGGNVINKNKSKCMLSRYDAHGKLDTAYGNKGYVILGRDRESLQLNDLVGYGDSNVLIIGGYVGENLDQSASQCMLWGLDRAGNPESGFNNGIMTLLKLTHTSGSQWVAGAASSNKITVASLGGHGEDADVYVARYHLSGIDGENTGGSLDKGFGAGVGWVRTPVGANVDQATGLVLQADHKIVVCGTSIAGAAINPFAVRYLG